jgi:hypothetical protein
VTTSSKFRRIIAVGAIVSALGIAPTAANAGPGDTGTHECRFDYRDEADRVSLMESEGISWFFRSRGPAEAVCDGEATTLRVRTKGRINLTPGATEAEPLSVRGRVTLSWSFGASNPTIVGRIRGGAICDDDGSCEIRASLIGTNEQGQAIIAILIGLLRRESATGQASGFQLAFEPVFVDS